MQFDPMTGEPIEEQQNEELKQEILSIDGVTDIIPSRQSLHATYKTPFFFEIFLLY